MMEIDERRCNIKRGELLESMSVRNTGTGMHYLGIPENPYFQQTSFWQLKDYPHTMKIGRQAVSLSLLEKLTDDDVTNEIKVVKELL